ncbi:hypothetical protein BH23CHL4_BH23CHL4_29020 [soil metagenome]
MGLTARMSDRDKSTFFLALRGALLMALDEDLERIQNLDPSKPIGPELEPTLARLAASMELILRTANYQPDALQ